MMSATETELGGHQMGYRNSAFALTSEPDPQLYVGGRIASVEQIRAWETEWSPQGLTAAQGPFIPAPPTGQYVSF